MLQVAHLACAAGDRTLFRDLSFIVQPGEVLQLRGPNGVGKTTLLRAIAGLGRPIEGSISFDGEPLHATPYRWAGLMLMQGHLSGWKQHQSVWDNLRSQAQLDTAQPIAPAGQIEHWLGQAGLSRQLHLPAGRLSAGQKRRMGLARLGLNLAGPRKVWLLDEPTTALDLAGQTLLIDLIARLVQSGGMVIAATHQALGLETRGINIQTLEIEPAQRRGSRHE
jgi:heme exporter protein A